MAVSPLLRELLVICTDTTLTEGEAKRVRDVIRDQLRRSSHEPLSLPAPRDQRLAAACAIATEQLHRPHTLAHLGRSVGASPRTLSRLFRDELGMTYPQWRTNVRLLRAMILLSSGSSVTATGQQCGWHTTSGFVDAFRRAIGRTPGAYKTTSHD